MVTVDHASPRPRFLLSREPRSSRSCPRSTSFSTLPVDRDSRSQPQRRCLRPRSGNAHHVCSPGVLGTDWGSATQKGRGSLADTSVSETSRKRARNGPAEAGGSGGLPAGGRSLPGPRCVGVRSGEPAPGCQHKGFDKAGSDSPRAPRTPGSVPIYSSASLVTQKQGGRSKPFGKRSGQPGCGGRILPGEGPPCGHQGP